MTNSLNPAIVLVRLGQAGPWNKGRFQHPVGFIKLASRALDLCKLNRHKMGQFKEIQFSASNAETVAFPPRKQKFVCYCQNCGEAVKINLKPGTYHPITGDAASTLCGSPEGRRGAQLSDTTTAICTWCQRPLDGKGAPKGQAQPENPSAHVPHGICFECKSKFYPPSIA